MKSFSFFNQLRSITTRRSLPTLCLGLYILFSQSAPFFLEMHNGMVLVGFIHILLFALSLLLILPLLNLIITKITISNTYTRTNTYRLKVFLSFFCISFTILFLWFLGSQPGSYSSDSLSQYAQAYYGKYNDWHPAIHTLLFFTLPLKTTGSVSAIIIFQIAYFSLFMGYFAQVICKYADLRTVILFVFCILASPFTLDILMFPWKDIAFSLASATCILFSANIYFTNGKWIEKRSHLILFSSAIALATLFRHNGILFSLPLLLAIIFFIPKKKWVVLTILSITCILCIKGPVYYFFDVSRPRYHTIEIAGFPLSIITHVAKECPECLDSQTSNFIKRMVQPLPSWKKYQKTSGFNSIKWKGIDAKVIEEAGTVNIIKMATKCFFAAPRHSAIAILDLTSQVYTINTGTNIGTYIDPNSYGIQKDNNLFFEHLNERYRIFFEYSKLNSIFSCIGTTLILMFCFITFKSNLTNKQHLRRLFLCLPIIIYVFGTMLLLSGPDIRFFFATQLVWPGIIIICIKENKEQPGTQISTT